MAGVTARTAMWKGWDDPSVAPDLDTDPALGPDDPAGLRGLNLVPFSVFPHYAPKWEQVHRDNAELLDANVICGHSHRTYKLADDSGIVVEWVAGGPEDLALDSKLSGAVKGGLVMSCREVGDTQGPTAEVEDYFTKGNAGADEKELIPDR